MTDKTDDESTGYDNNPGGRPKKYASAAERQAAYRARASEISFRADEITADNLSRIADAIDVPRTDLILSMIKFALANHDWARFGLTHKTLPKYQGNPIMATKAQLAARARFAEMARSGAFKKSSAVGKHQGITRGRVRPALKAAPTRASNPAPAKRKSHTVVYQVLTRKPRGAFVPHSIWNSAEAAKAEAQMLAVDHPTWAIRVDSFSVKG
jgi:hypothetical protein